MNSAHKTLSRQTILGILFIGLFINANAQKTISKVYVNAGAGWGTYESNPGEIGITTIIKNKWSATFSYQGLSMAPKNRPADYRPETGYIFFVPYTYEALAEMNMVSATAGRYFKLGRNTWATTEAGLSYVTGEKVNFQRSDVVNSDLIIFASTSSNYTTTTEKTGTVGAALRADLNWGFSSFMGLGCSVFANVNSIQSPVGFQIKLIVGYMGREKKKR